MDTRKKSFVFNVAWQEVLLDYPSEVRLEVYDAIIEYAASGTLPELKPLAKMAFSFIKKEIDYYNDKYEETVSKRREAGRKGMLLRYGGKDKGDELTNVTKGNKPNKCQQELTNVTDNVYDNDIKENIPNGISKKGELSLDGFDYSEFMERFNESLGDFIPSIRVMTDSRRKAVRSRIREHGVDSVKLVFDSVKRSSFLTGRGDSDWKATFDWIFSPRNYVKIMEGNYDDKEQHDEQPAAIYTIPG